MNEWMNELFISSLAKNYYGEKRTWTITQWLNMEIIYTVNYNISSKENVPYFNVLITDLRFTQCY